MRTDEVQIALDGKPFHFDHRRRALCSSSGKMECDAEEGHALAILQIALDAFCAAELHFFFQLGYFDAQWTKRMGNHFQAFPSLAHAAARGSSEGHQV